MPDRIRRGYHIERDPAVSRDRHIETDAGRLLHVGIAALVWNAVHYLPVGLGICLFYTRTTFKGDGRRALAAALLR
jgi:hypothetical protein